MKHNFSIVHFEELDSSNDHAKQHASSFQDKTVIWCDHQRNGRGRFERIWESGEDLTFSILFQEDGPHHLLAPLAVVNALRTLHCECQIKWPNDVLYQGKKLCGILVEKVFQGDAKPCIVVGIGINLTPVPTLLQHKATYLPFQASQLLPLVLAQYEDLLSKSREVIWELYRANSYLQGRKILQNDVLWEVLDISGEGYLIVQHKSEVCMWKSEEITLEHIY